MMCILRKPISGVDAKVGDTVDTSTWTMARKLLKTRHLAEVGTRAALDVLATVQATRDRADLAEATATLVPVEADKPIRRTSRARRTTPDATAA